MDKALKIAVIVAVLLAGGGVFYHYVIFLPDLERRKIEQAEQERREAAQRAEQQRLNAARQAEQEKAAAAQQQAERQYQYQLCMQQAGKSYEANWALSCKDVARIQLAQRNSCLATPVIVNNPYMGKNYCYRTYAISDASPNCSLPKARADSIEKALRDDQQRCLAEARSGL